MGAELSRNAERVHDLVDPALDQPGGVDALGGGPSHIDPLLPLVRPNHLPGRADCLLSGNLCPHLPSWTLFYLAKAEKKKKEEEKRLGKVEEKENEEEKKCCLCLPLCPNNPGVEYEDGVRLFWNATVKSNCKEKLAKKDLDDREKGNQEDEAGKVVKKVEYKVEEEKDGKEEGVSLLPIVSA